MQNNLKICFIGGGNMAQALIGGLAGRLTAASNIHVVDVMPAYLEQGLLKRNPFETIDQVGVKLNGVDWLLALGSAKEWR